MTTTVQRVLVRSVITTALLALTPPVTWAHATAQSSVGIVKFQRPGIDGNPSFFDRLTSLLVNKPNPLATSAALQDRDGLLGEEDTSAVQITCPGGATLVLSGKFDAYLRLGGGKDYDSTLTPTQHIHPLCFAAVLATLTGPKVNFINSQGTLAPVPGSWHNKLHPGNTGFNRLANPFPGGTETAVRSQGSLAGRDE